MRSAAHMSGRKFRRKLVPSDGAAAPDVDDEQEPGSLAIPPSALAARRPDQAPPAQRPVTKPLLSFGGDEDDSVAPVRRGTAAKGREPDGRSQGVARAAAVTVTEVRVGASTQVSVAGAQLPASCGAAGRQDACNACSVSQRLDKVLNFGQTQFWRALLRCCFQLLALLLCPGRLLMLFLEGLPDGYALFCVNCISQRARRWAATGG